MAFLKLPKKQNLGLKNPIEKLCVDWGNPLNNDLQALYRASSDTPILLGKGDKHTYLASGTAGRVVKKSGMTLSAETATTCVASNNAFPGVGTGDITLFSYFNSGLVQGGYAYHIALDGAIGIASRNDEKTYVYAGGSVIGTTTLLDHTDYTLIAVRKSGVLKLYLNAIEEASASNTFNITDKKLCLLAYNTGGSYSSVDRRTLYLAGYLSRAWSVDEIKTFHKAPFKLLKPVGDPVYFIPDAGGAITGTGSPQATTATSSGTAEREITGTGSPSAPTATSTGSGAVSTVITGTGTPQAETATSSGVAEREITSSGSPQATTATSSGSGLRLITGSGTPQAVTATASGTGLRLITGSATTQAETATSTGSGQVGSAVIGSGSPQAETATASGTGLRLITGSGSPQAEAATTTATGIREITSSGTPQAGAATSTGSGSVGNVVTGSGTTQADTATSTGEGLRVIIGSGAPQADTATTSASGTVSGNITGTGSPQATTATASGVGLRLIIGSGSTQATTATAYGTSAPNTTIHPGRIYTVEAENTTYTAEAEDRVYNVG